MTKLSESRHQSGFTIIELLIATMVFSMIMVVLTFGVLSFTKAYYKGVTASSTQRVARTTIDEVSQAIQFSGLKAGPIATGLPDTAAAATAHVQVKGFCVGGTRYSYLPGWQLEDGVSADTVNFRNKYVFVRDTPNNGCAENSSQVPQNLLGGSVQGTELLSPHMRVSKADLSTVDADPNLYTMTIKIVYGDSDLLADLGQSDSEQANAAHYAKNATNPGVTCRNATAGTQFCAISELSTTIQRRVN